MAQDLFEGFDTTQIIGRIDFCVSIPADPLGLNEAESLLWAEAKGFSDKNLWRMKQFYETYKDADEKLSALLRQISWTNNLTIMSRSETS